MFGYLVSILYIYVLVSVSWASHLPEGVDWSTAVVDRCTTIVVGRTAGKDGPMTTHTADCSNCDFRINKVPAKDWPKDSKRPLYLYKGDYPSTIASDRGATWHPKNLEGNEEQLKAWGKESVITGYVPQVPHTFALLEAGYGIMNEYQVAIGESTCAARFWAAPTIAGGKAQIEVRQMSQIALERATTARSAIKIMGDLATAYGFYAADWSGGDMSKGEGGEALTVIDKNEAWVFHVLADDTGTSAVWAAQRVPDGHVAAVANQFVIRNIDPHSQDFLFSDNIFDVAKRNGLWDESRGQLDFLKTFAPPRAHSPYATRRVWRVFTLVSPGISLNPYTDAYASDYPFSVPASRPLSHEDIMALNRDHYEGSAFDLTKGLAAGPYGDPNRFDMSPQPQDNLTFVDMLQGSYERSISLFRTSYSIVATARTSKPDILGLLWFSQYAPSSSSYVPIYVSAASLPPGYTRGSLFKYDSSVSFWNFLAVGNYASRFYKYAMVDVVELQRKLQDDANSAIKTLEDTVEKNFFFLYGTTARTLTDSSEPSSSSESSSVDSVRNAAIIGMTTALTIAQGEKTIYSWAEFLPKLITKFHDGYRAEGLDQPSIAMRKLFYSKAWLDATGYWDNKPNKGGDTIMFMPSPIVTSSGFSGGVVGVLIVMTAALAMAMGVALAPHLKHFKVRDEGLEFSKEILDDDSSSGIAMGSFRTESAHNSVLSSNVLSAVPFQLSASISNALASKNAQRPNRKDYVSIDL